MPAHGMCHNTAKGRREGHGVGLQRVVGAEVQVGVEDQHMASREAVLRPGAIAVHRTAHGPPSECVRYNHAQTRHEPGVR